MHKIIKKLTAFLLLFIVFLTGCSAVYKEKIYTVFSSLYMTVKYHKGSDNGIKALADKLDEEINPDYETSYVSIFNKMNAGEIRVSKQVYDLVSLSLDLYQTTQGAFDITLSSLSRLWSVDHKSLELYSPSSFPQLPTVSSLSTIESEMQNISVREQDGAFYIAKSTNTATIDLGGIAKGYLADIVAQKLKDNGTTSAVIDVTGNLYLLGNKTEKDGTYGDWKIGVNNCFNSGNEYLCGIVCPPSVSIVTSGTYERNYEKDGVLINHIINPFTKMPVGVKYDNGYKNESSYVVSTTVIGESSAVCDAIATAVCVLGLTNGANLVQSLNLSAIIVTSDKKYTVIGSIENMNGEFELNKMERA